MNLRSNKNASAECYLSMSQAVTIANEILNALTEGKTNHKKIGIEAVIHGPALFSIAGTIRITRTVVLSVDQRKALKILREAGLNAEADIFHIALQHEDFYLKTIGKEGH